MRFDLRQLADNHASRGTGCARVCRGGQRGVAAAIAATFVGTAAAGTYTASTEAELIQVINFTNTTGSADTVNITADITLTAQLPLITEALTIAGSGAQRRISRDDTGTNACSPTATNAFRLIDAGADLTLEDLILTGGCNLVDGGGAVRVQHAALSVVNSTVSGNQTFFPGPAACYTCLGGGIAVLYGSASITGSTISANATHGYTAIGGGVGAYQADLTIAQSTISGNVAEGSAGSSGGGAYAMGTYPSGPAANLTITGSTISGNIASADGAFAGGAGGYLANVSIDSSVVVGNQVKGGGAGYGGGVVLKNHLTSTTAQIRRTLISGNSVAGGVAAAGGVLDEGVTFDLVDSAVVGNSVHGDTKARAGAIKIATAQARLIGSTLSGNSIDCAADEGGGAIQVLSSYGYTASLTAYNSTIAANQSPHSNAGGIFFKREKGVGVQPTAVLESTILAGNIGASGDAEIGSAADTGTAADITAHHALIQGTVDPGTGTLTLDAVTLALFGSDPQLLPLAYNGGITPTRALSPTSTAIDQGTNTQSLASDQRGLPYAREVGAAADIGAYELDTDRISANGFE